MAIQVLGVDNVLFGVGDFGEARAFYEGKLGLPVKFAVEAMGIVGYRLGSDEVGLFLRVQPIAPTPARETPRLWLEVAMRARPPSNWRHKVSLRYGSRSRSTPAGSWRSPTPGATSSA